MTDGTVQETRMRFLSLCFCHRRFLQPRVKHKERFFLCDYRAGAAKRNQMKNLFLGVTIAFLIGIGICHGKTGDTFLQLALRYLIDGILVVVWLNVAFSYRMLSKREKSLREAIRPIQIKEDRLCREMDSLMAAAIGVIDGNPEIFKR